MIYYFYVDPSGNFDEVLLGYNPETIRVYILEYNKRKRDNVKRAKKEDK